MRASRRLREVAVGLVRVREGDLFLSVRELAYASQSITKEIFGGCVHLGDSTSAVEVLVCSIVQDLGETCVEIKRVVHSVLREAVAESVVGVGGCLPAADGGQSIGGIIGIRVHAIVEQVAVVVPCVSNAVYACESICYIILITVHC